MNLKNITVSFGKKNVFDGFSLAIPKNKITCILGPSGCGKTTLLNCIAGAVPYSGTIEDKPSNVAFIFQTPCLIPSMTVEKNIEYVLKSHIKNKNDRKKIISDILEAVGLKDEKKSYPSSLSGGMAQRVSLARAFCFPSECILMDEPFVGLDVSLKKQILRLFFNLYEGQNKTAVFVTHDIDEALLTGDKIVVIKSEGEYEEFYCDIPRSARTPSSLTELKETVYSLL